MSRPDRIHIRGLRVHGYHGVLGSEQRVGQTFAVDVTIDTDTRLAAATDDLESTVDYGALATDLAAVVAGDPVRLIETLAQRLADVCLARTAVAAVEVTVSKPDAPIEAIEFDVVAVTIYRTRTP